MDWVTSIHQAIQYIEEHLREELTIREIAQQAALSSFYFQKGFAMLCGMTVGDYIRQRRLSAAGLEVLTTDRKIIDIALEFGYDSPDSFTRAFARFHGLTPAALRKSGGAVRSFAPLRIKVILEGGQNMDCKIMKKEAFTVLCRAMTFKYEDAAAQEALTRLDERLDRTMKAVEASYEKNKERWVDALFSMIVGVEPS